MYNFSNLNDVEFEYLCKDVMSKMLNVELQRFASGRDGGIDLTDNVFQKNIIVQVKYYIKTDVSGLMTALKKEIKNVKENKPKQYYVCCSKELTYKNKRDIYTMFSDYMESERNIISLIEISDFLDRVENADILRRHFKLWIESTNILHDIYTNDICIDSDTLLYDIKDSECMFVKTSAYDQAISCLEKNNVLIIVGDPGVGKTITSKMLTLYYASLGYRIRYTTDGTDLAALKRSLSQSPDAKEIILLDDCFGQAYFSMKETQENELLLLIRYVNYNSNKILIMNSRVTIFQEAKERTPNLVKSLDCKEYRVFVLDMNHISELEKAMILYNHLFFNNVPQAYRDDIKKEKKYRDIVRHPNYNPRIIEFVCNSRQLEAVAPNQYAAFIFQCLQNPEQIWKNEYERRLENTDRILLTTLYSLTNTVFPRKLVKKCYEYRISGIPGVDLSINQFEQSVKRLLNSMIKITDVDGIEMFSVANPSVNDFLRNHLEENLPEKSAIIEKGISVFQFKRLLSEEKFNAEMKRVFEDKSVLKFIFESEEQKGDFIVYYCAMNKVLDNVYRPYLKAFVLDIHEMNICEARKYPGRFIIKHIFEESFCSFYGLGEVILDLSVLPAILGKMDLIDLVEFIKSIDYLFKAQVRESYLEIVIEILEKAIMDYCSDVSADAYVIDIEKIVKDCCFENEYGDYFDSDSAVRAVEDAVIDSVLEEMEDIISDISEDIVIDEDFWVNLDICVDGSEALIEGYSQDYYYDVEDDYGVSRNQFWDSQEIDYIFER